MPQFAPHSALLFPKKVEEFAPARFGSRRLSSFSADLFAAGPAWLQTNINDPVHRFKDRPGGGKRREARNFTPPTQWQRKSIVRDVKSEALSFSAAAAPAGAGGYMYGVWAGWKEGRGEMTGKIACNIVPSGRPAGSAIILAARWAV